MSAPAPAAPYDALTAQARSLLFQTASYLNADDALKLETACAYAFRAHDGQTRKSGEPYITHPIAVATELAKWHMDIQTLSAGLMHDVLEDTGTTKAELAAAFGDTIAEMVDGLSKLEKLQYGNHVEHQAESFRKLIMAMTKDIRIIIVKLSDRLHNMRTLGSMRLDKRRRISVETLEIYAPIANRIGLNPVFRELQDLAFQNIHPSRYQTLQKAMAAFRRRHRNVISQLLKEFSLHLVDANIEAQIKGREKNLYSIHQKMLSKKLRFREVMDIYGFRIITNNIPSCYAALGVLHGMYQPKLGKFKDYIAIPKSNGYQSLHTTLSGPNGLPLEVQIRTRDMDAVAESGIASHWAYKSGEGKTDQATLSANKWLQNIMDFQARSANAVEFLEHVKVDLFPNEVYVFSPKGKIFSLPEGATPVDFAYAVHSDIGNHTIGAQVNNKPAALRTRLKNGDTVQVITAENAYPNANWLNFVVSSRARSAIRNYLKNMKREDAVRLGEILLQKALVSLLPQEVLSSDLLRDEYMNELSANESSFQDILYNVGMGNMLPINVAMKLADLAERHLGGEVKLSPIKISGGETGRVHLANCCNPIPGDAIRAVLSPNQGMVIHRDSCPKLLKVNTEHQLDADWDTLDGQIYHTELLISSKDAHGLLAAMTSAMSVAGADIEAVDTPSSAQSGTEGFIEFRFRLRVSGLQQLEKIIHVLNNIPQVQRIVRL
ncbi:MAG: bifunctional (p)ppGpp synthetase/guanosine-3',5'-bis(diphosphate) 3'-pyrophosphohydrolase [Neisseria sp.]|nr:bifunctional (p)ppGpp synthetase/guanosine-3',5'-bis(diphosphate) 3'-pyrophosphohydrolase [Neisseria sp.]